MSRAFTTPFPGPDQSGLGFAHEPLIPPSIAATLYAAYILTNQGGHDPMADISQNGRDATNVGIDFSRGDFPVMSNKDYVLAPFSGADFTVAAEGTMLVVVKASVATNHVIAQGKTALSPALNNLPDTDSPLLYLNSASKVVAQQDYLGSVSSTSGTADASATDFHMIGWSARKGDGTGATLGRIRSYRKRAGQTSIYASTSFTQTVLFGTNPMTLGYDASFSANTYQVAAAFFISALLDQAAMDAAYAEIATLVNPYLTAAGVGTL